MLKIGSDGFEPVDPASLDQVSGANLMIAAYAIILGAIVLYALILMLRERSTRASIRKLNRQIELSSKQQ